MSYTDFELSKPIISSATMSLDDTVTVKVKVKNNGKFDGTEVVQMYLRDDFSEIARPDKELKGYKRVFLRSGEETTVTFEINVDTLSYYGEDNKFVAEKGSFTIYISRDGKSFDECKLQLT